VSEIAPAIFQFKVVLKWLPHSVTMQITDVNFIADTVHLKWEWLILMFWTNIFIQK